MIQEFGDSREYIVRTSRDASSAGDIGKQVEVALRGHSSLGPFEIRRVEFVAPRSAATSKYRPSMPSSPG